MWREQAFRVRVGRWAAIVCRPDWWAYGDFLLGVCTALAIAHREGSLAVLIREGKYARDAAYDVRVDGIPTVVVERPWALVAAALLTARAAGLTAWTWLRDAVGDAWLACAGALRDMGTARADEVKRRGIARLWRDRRKRSARRQSQLSRGQQLWHGRDQNYFLYDVRRTLANGWPGARLGDRSTEAAVQAARLGLEAGMPIVTVHVREAGWHGTFTNYQAEPKDAKRNADITTFFPAFDRLRASGVRVVRIGDRTMTPVNRTGVIDLTRDQAPDNLLQLWAVQHSRFMIACDSGPFALGWLFNVPLLMANVVCHLECYPLRPLDRMLTKQVLDESGTRYTARDMWQYDFLAHYKNLPPERYVSNTPDELVSAVEEMLELTDRGRRHASPPTAEQLAIRDLADNLNRAPELMEKRSQRADPAFVYTGDGFISRAQAPGIPTTPYATEF